MVRRLGQGGQGTVWQAIHEASRRKVALKLIRPEALSDPRARARFEQEYETLRQLSHPNIVAVLARGELPGGALWHATEYISGYALHEFVHELDRSALDGRGGLESRRAFPLREVLGLFIRICDAVQAAHAVGVIHRDLKPTNVLVDERGEPHLLDFGLARPATRASPDAVTLTQEFLGSPTWASPEQVEARPALIDVRTDVYALGIMLYHCLTGRFPYDVSGPLAQVFDQIRRADRVRPGAHATFIDRELDAVILKAIARDRSERYASAQDLADELRRYLSGRPVQARGDSRWYRTVKFVRRHWAAAAATTAVLVLTIVYAATMSVMFVRQRAATARAEQERRSAAQVLEFIESTIQAVGDDAELKRGLTILEFVEPARARIPEQLRGQPLAEATLRRTIGRMLLALGEYSDAEKELVAASEAFANLLGPEHEHSLACREGAATGALENGRTEAAEREFRALLAIRREQAIRSPLSPDVKRRLGQALNNLAECLNRNAVRRAEAEPLFAESLAICRELAPEGDLETAQVMNNLGLLYGRLGDMERAAPLLSGSLELKRRLLGPDSPMLARGLHNLGVFHMEMGQLDVARGLLEEAETQRRRILGDRHPELAATLNGLGKLDLLQNRHVDAERRFRAALDIRRATLPNGHADLGESANNLAALLRNTGRLAEALPIAQEAVSIYRARGAEHPLGVGVALNVVADIYRERGEPDVAEPIFRESLAILRGCAGPGPSPYVARSLHNLARCLCALECFDAAEIRARESLALWRAMSAPAEMIASTTLVLSDCLAGQRRRDEALEELCAAVDLIRTLSVPGDLPAQAARRLALLADSDDAAGP
ncbi:MAG: serine/threonine protein kinase [Phycisphaerae bacterium]